MLRYRVLETSKHTIIISAYFSFSLCVCVCVCVCVNVTLTMEVCIIAYNNIPYTAYRTNTFFIYISTLRARNKVHTDAIQTAR